MEYPSPTSLAAPAFAIAVLLEWIGVATGRMKGRYDVHDAFASIAMGVGNLIMNTLTAFAAFWMLTIFWPLRILTLPVNLMTFIILFVGYDFIYYWKHRFAHRIRWFWMEHVTHHSSQNYNLTTALRQPWFGPFTGLILLGAPLVVLGFHPAFIFFVGGLNLVYQFWVHTEAIDRMPDWFERIFNTPSHHRVHHAINPRYLDSNYAGVLIIWDKMFGTFTPEISRDPPRYGIVNQLNSYNPFVIAFHEAKALLNDCKSDGLHPLKWARRLLNAPGWSPEGLHRRTLELKQAHLAKHPEDAGEVGFENFRR